MCGADAFRPSGSSQWVSPFTISRARKGLPKSQNSPLKLASRSSFVVRAAEAAASSNEEAIAPAVVSPLAGGTVLVSGFLDSSAHTDQFVFDLVHKHGLFKKVVAYAPDAAAAKKRLVSRSARYSGLLNVLDFKEGNAAGLLEPGALEGVDAWLAFGVPAADLPAVCAAAGAAAVKHLVAVATAGGSATPVAPAAAAATAALGGSDTIYTIFQVGSVVGGKEGGAVVLDRGESAASGGAGFPRDEAARVATAAFLLQPAANAVFALTVGDEVALDFQKDLRRKGYDRTEEVGFLMTGGYQEFAAKAAEAKAEAEAKAAAAAAPPRDLTPEELAAKEKEAAERAAFWEQERAAEREEQLLARAEKECNANYIKQRYRTEPDEELAERGMPDFGIGQYEDYKALNFDKCLAELRTVADWDGANRLIIMREEDKERERDIEAAREALLEMRRKEEEEELKSLTWVCPADGKTYLKFNRGLKPDGSWRKEIVLDAEGETILGQWNGASIEPFVDELAEGYEDDGEEVVVVEDDESLILKAMLERAQAEAKAEADGGAHDKDVAEKEE